MKLKKEEKKSAIRKLTLHTKNLHFYRDFCNRKKEEKETCISRMLICVLQKIFQFAEFFTPYSSLLLLKNAGELR